jgi:excisionase family DNA binding protein
MTHTFSIEDAMNALDTGRTKLYQLINSGELKAHKLGRRTIILRKDIDEFLSTLTPYRSPRKISKNNGGSI